MHYGPWVCANSSLPVITKPDGSPITLTKTDTFSELDIEQINYIYDCKLVSLRISLISLRLVVLMTSLLFSKPTATTTQSPSVTTPTEFCSDQIDGIYAHPDCKKFYQCSYKRTFIKSCPNGLLFNSQFKYCDWPANVKCESSTTNAPTSTVTTTARPSTTKHATTESTEAEKENRNFCKDKADGFYIHPICEKYYRCYHSGTTHIGQCQNGLIWNPNLNVCDWPSNYNCD